MHNNFYFLRQLSAKLNDKITGYSIVSCFSQNKDELVIELNNSKESFFIKANLEPDFCCLSFPDEFHRARKNSIDLFNSVILKGVVKVRQIENERSFSFDLEGDISLIFKMHGNFANVVLTKENRVEEIFRNHLQTDLTNENRDKPIDISKDNFFRNINNLPATFFTLGKVVFEYLHEQNFEQLDPEAKWQLFNQTIQMLEKPVYYITELRGRLIFSLLPMGKIIHKHSDPIQAINAFAGQTLRDKVFLNEKREALSYLQTRLKNNEAYVSKSSQKLKELEQDHHYQLWADLIMANLHTLAQGQEKISLESFYDGKPVEIKLKKELSPQKNAEVFYRKSKNHQIEVTKLRDAVNQKEQEISKLKSWITEVDETSDVRALREQLECTGAVKKTSVQSEPLPYREFEFKNYKIWVGKNAEANDKLTLKYSFKEDLWLHAKDVAGSHVLIKHQAGKNFPKDVIEYAAGLAAYYSKRKNESLCPVAITPKKFVRKKKGDPAGMVVVDKENVILVPPAQL
ncbi:hypothetical protein WSM22_24430 [Cytophagales bacterium WSM2-2]|nr:hypothetical protein WSM22_24430 [Cytophagales bacterium WSM2-2]